MPIPEMTTDFARVCPYLPGRALRVASLLALATSTGCYDQAFVPDDEADDRITITNDEIELERRVEYVDEVILPGGQR